MNRKLRYALVGLAIVVIILLAVPLFLDVNQFRPTVEQNLSAALGRQAKVGNLSLSLFSGSLEADNLSIADDPAFSTSPFLAAKSLKVGVAMMPLIFSKALHVTALTIDKPEVTLLRNPEGKWNFSSLAAKSATAPPSAPKGQGSAAPEFSIGKLKLSNGRVTVGSTTSPKRSVYDDVNLEASNVSLSSEFPITLSANLPSGGDLKMEGKVGPLDRTDAALSPLTANLTINKLDLARTGFLDPASGIAGLVDMTGTVNSNNGVAKTKGTVKLTNLQMHKGGAPAGTPVNVDFDSDYDLRRSAGTLNQSIVKIGAAVAHLAGTFETRGEATAVNLKLNATNMPVKDLETVLPAAGIMLPKGASLEQGTLSTNLVSSGPADKLVTSGDVGLYNAKIAGFDLGSKLSALSALSGSKGSGGGDTVIEKLTSNLHAAPEGIQLSALQMIMPAYGQLSGNGTISADHALNFKMLATLAGGSSTAGGLGGLTGKGAGNEQIPFFVQGTTSDPKFVPDISGMAKSEINSQLHNVLPGNKQGSSGMSGALGGLFGNKKK